MLGGLTNLSHERMFLIKLIGHILRFGIKYWTTATIIYGLALRSSVTLRYKSLFDLNLPIRSLTLICFFLSINIIFMNYFGILYIMIRSLNFLIWFLPRHNFTKLLYWTRSELFPNGSLGLLIGKLNFLKYDFQKNSKYFKINKFNENFLAYWWIWEFNAAIICLVSSLDRFTNFDGWTKLTSSIHFWIDLSEIILKSRWKSWLVYFPAFWMYFIFSLIADI